MGVLTLPSAALVCGGTIRDVRVGRFLVFITFWSLLVYDPVARWSWHWAGWSNQRDVMDFAGGTAVHITSGTTVLAFYIFYELDTKGFSKCWAGLMRRLVKPFAILGFCRKKPGNDHNSEEHELENQSSTSHQGPEEHKPENQTSTSHQGPEEHEPENQTSTSHQGPEEQAALHALADPEAAVPCTSDQPSDLEDDDPPHNVNNMILGTALLWIGWFGFNGGSALGGNMRAVSACVSTHVAACAGGTTSLFFFWAWNAFGRAVDRFLGESGEQENKIPSVSATQFCDGAVIGLVAITPAAGYVGPLPAVDGRSC